MRQFPCVYPITLLLALTLSTLAGQGAWAGPSDSPPQPADLVHPGETPTPRPLLLDDVVEPLPPQRQRTEAQQDRVEAIALFSAARALEGRRQYADALRGYQRALRYDPQSETLARGVVRLAIELKRLDEAVRVAVKFENPNAFDPRELMGLGLYLWKKGDLRRAAAMYRKVLAASEAPKQTPGQVALTAELGRIYYVLGQHAKAADSFAEIREALEDPGKFGLDEKARKRLLGEPGPTHLLMGECFLRSDRVDEARAAFEKAHQLKPDENLLNYNLARVEADSGKPAEALVRLERCLKNHLSDQGMEPYQLLARLLEDLGKETELIQRLEKLHADDPENESLAFFVAQAYGDAKQLDKAESLYRALVAKAPSLPGFRGLAAIYRETNRPEALLKVLGEAAAADLTVDALGAEGRRITEDADLVKTLIETARKQLHDNPDQFNFPLRWAVAALALDAKQFEAAKRFFQLALEADAEKASELVLVWGLGLLAEEQYAEAVRVFQRGIGAKAPSDDAPVYYYYLAGALEMDGRTDDALAAARKAVELNQDSPDFLSRPAWILYHADRREEAVKAYTGLIEKFDSDFTSSDVRQVMRQARLALSNLAVLTDDLPQSEEWLEQVLDEFPDDVAALNDLGYLWADRNVRLQRAYRMIRQAVEADPENAAYRDSLGWVLYRLGRPDEALPELEKAAASEAHPEILDHLGDVYRATKRPERAKDAWQRAVAAFKEKSEHEKAEKVRKKIEKHP